MNSAAIRGSLFDAAPASIVGAAGGWMTDTLGGPFAVALCVLAVAFVGLLLMSGRLAVREALRVALGCFVLIGAPAIAAGLLGAADDVNGPVSREAAKVYQSPSPPALPPASYDPYAGASLRQE